MLTGSLVALVTPMGDDGCVDYGALERLVDWHVESGAWVEAEQAIAALETTKAVFDVAAHATQA